MPKSISNKLEVKFYVTSQVTRIRSKLQNKHFFYKQNHHLISNPQIVISFVSKYFGEINYLEGKVQIFNLQALAPDQSDRYPFYLTKPWLQSVRTASMA